MTIVVWIQLAVLVVLLFFSGFFSGSETALTSLGKLRSKRLMSELRNRDEDLRFARDLEYWLEESEDILISILIGNNLINIAASALATVVATEIFQSVFQFDQALALGSSVAVGLVTFFVLVFGEITPKSYAKQNPETFARVILRPIILFTKAITPAIFAMRLITRFILRAGGWEMPRSQTRITEEELKQLVYAGGQEGALEPSELEMLHSVFDFDETVVREVLTPRVDVVALEVGTSYEQMLEVVRDTGFSRFPVYREKLDQIVGVLNIKDLITQPDIGEDNFDLESISRPAYFVPESKKVDQLLAEFRRNQVHLAIVVDEYGGVSGVITLEDVIEQIVGEIQDEFDDEEDWIVPVEEDSYLVDARIDLDELVESLHLDLPSEKYDSLGGMIVEELGRIPREGHELDLMGMHFKVVSADRKRVKKVRLSVTDETEAMLSSHVPGVSEGSD